MGSWFEGGGDPAGGAPRPEVVIGDIARLPARHVIHAVGPVWRGGGHGERDCLAARHRRSLELAAGSGLRSIALPAISTGRDGYPPAEAVDVALECAGPLPMRPGHALRAVFRCHSAADAAFYGDALARAGAPRVEPLPVERWR